jgi:hypothetical protein
MITVRIDPLTGRLASSRTPNALFETFTPEQMPDLGEVPVDAAGGGEPQLQPDLIF